MCLLIASERSERADLVVSRARFFYIYIYICSPVAAHIKGADELLICAMPAARNVNIIHSLFALQPML